ncbi:hypothetical protein PTKIN_Ptkin17bG0146300 [Pterospermum kingtungense]
MMVFVMSNFMTFLTDFWKLKLIEALTIVNLREGLKNTLQIYVALCIDSFLGYRRMLILSSVLYSAGLGLLAFSMPQHLFNNKRECPAERVDCFKTLKHTPFWEGLALLIAGGAAQVIPLRSLSFGQTITLKVPEYFKQTRGCSFKVKIAILWRYWRQRFIRFLCIAFMMLGIITSVYGFISSESEWQRRFMISAIAIAIGLIWFLCGFPFYGPRKLQSSTLFTMLRVLIAAVRKRHLNYRQQPLHRGHGDDREQPLTDHLECLNNAAAKKSPADEGTKWKLCTVKEVEQTKLVLNIIPMSMTFVAYGMVKSLGDTFFIDQANSIREGTPIVVLLIIQKVSQILVKKGYEIVIEKRIERIGRRYSDGVKIGLGMVASIICCAVASPVESRRLKGLRQEGLSNHPKATAPAPAPNSALDPNATAPISAFLFVPQFFFLGVMEGLAGDGIQDFFSHYVPDSRRYATVLTSSLTGFGTLLNIGFITILNYYSKSKYKESWFGDSINQSHLDFIYRAYIIVALLNCFLYACVATRYSYDNIIGRPEEAEEEEEIIFLEA